MRYLFGNWAGHIVINTLSTFMALERDKII